MGCACFTLPEPDPWQEVSRMAHQALDEWLEGLKPLFTQAEPPTLRDLSAEFMRTRGTLLGACLETLATQLHGHYQDQLKADCPGCGKCLNRKRVDPKTMTTLQGPVTLSRPYFHCRDCQLGFHPLDEALVLAQAAHQYDIQEKFTRLSAKMPYHEAVAEFAELTGIKVSNHLGHETLNRIAEAATLETVIPTREEIERRIEAAKTSPKDRPVLVVAVDGAYAPTRPKGPRKGKRGKGEWKEVKGFRLYLTGADPRITQLASWHQFQDAEQFTQDLAWVAERIPQEKVRIALLGDGASWLWNAMTQCFPTGRCVLDYYHCAEHLYTVAKAQFEDLLEVEQWVEAAASWLSLDQPDLVISWLEDMKPADAHAEEEIRKLIGYLDNNRERLGYAKRREEGLPIGSGGIESANKYISHARLKRSGAWWLIPNGNNMLRLRCALYNGTYGRVLQRYIENRHPQHSNSGTNG
jgi:hypothetical protein